MNNFLGSILLSAIVIVSLGSCNTANNDQNSISEIVESVWQYSLDNSDGFTIEIPTLTTPTSGLAVGYYIGQENVGKESLSSVVKHALENDKYVGGWLDTEDGEYYFDSIRIFEDGADDYAQQFAIENQQRAYYDLTNEVTIYITNEGD